MTGLLGSGGECLGGLKHRFGGSGFCCDEFIFVFELVDEVVTAEIVVGTFGSPHVGIGRGIAVRPIESIIQILIWKKNLNGDSRIIIRDHKYLSTELKSRQRLFPPIKTCLFWVVISQFRVDYFSSGRLFFWLTGFNEICMIVSSYQSILKIS